MRRLALATVAIIGVLAAAPALADTIDFSKLGGDGTLLADGATGMTADHVKYTLTGPGGGYELLIQGTDWDGTFATGSTVLWDTFTPGPGSITITFASPITSLTGVTAEPNLHTELSEQYTATLTAYGASGLLGSDSVSGTDIGAADQGTVPGLSFTSALGITSVVFSISGTCSGDLPCDAQGIALGPFPASASVPEPATWALMLAGFGALGAALRVSRRRTAAATA